MQFKCCRCYVHIIMLLFNYLQKWLTCNKWLQNRYWHNKPHKNKQGCASRPLWIERTISVWNILHHQTDISVHPDANQSMLLGLGDEWLPCDYTGIRCTAGEAAVALSRHCDIKRRSPNGIDLSALSPHHAYMKRRHSRRAWVYMKVCV